MWHGEYSQPTLHPNEPPHNGLKFSKIPHGSDTVPFTGAQLTVGGELNKLAQNMSIGRDMSGVHWRVADDLTGLFHGEAVAIRLLTEAKATYPEPNATFTLTKFDGTTITI